MGKISVGGIHHVTAIAEDAQRNVDFYTDVLGLRFVKKTVNQDDRSYFREPGAILFETASDDPGFAIDEDAGRLGSELKLTTAHEPLREQIEAKLPPIHVPKTEGATP